MNNFVSNKNFPEEFTGKKDILPSFSPNYKQFDFNSIILLEIFNFEDFANLIAGLDKLYASIPDKTIFNDRSNLEQIQKGLKTPLNYRVIDYLPGIYNSRDYEKEPSIRLCLDLGENICNIQFLLHRISSSLLIMRIEVELKSNVSNRLNKLLKESITSLKYEKNIQEANKLKLNLKKEIINFLSTFFKGQFFKLCKYDYSIVPTIDILCLKYPKNNDDIIFQGGRPFNRFLGYSIDMNNSFKSGPYVLCKEIYDLFFSYSFPPKERKLRYHNYILFVNQNLIDSNKYDIKTDIVRNLQISILALDRITSLNKNILRELNAIISDEIQNLEKNKLNHILENRKKISKDIFQFKRFKIEFERLKFKDFSDSLNRNLIFLRKNTEEHNFFEYLLLYNIKQTEDIDNSINTLNQNFNLTLNLKNIEYSNKLLVLTSKLTWLIVGLTIILVFLEVLLHYI